MTNRLYFATVSEISLPIHRASTLLNRRESEEIDFQFQKKFQFTFNNTNNEVHLTGLFYQAGLG